MKKVLKFLAVPLMLTSLLVLAGNSSKTQAQTAPAQGSSRYPMLDKIADKVIQKYEQSTCEQLSQENANKTPPSRRMSRMRFKY